MDEFIREFIENHAKDILKAESIESYNRRSGYARGIIHGFFIADEITEEEYHEMIALTEEIEDLYWEQGIVDFKSSYRKLFPEK